MFGSLVRNLSARPRGSVDAATPERTLAILVSARALLARGWVQGAWYVMEAPDGRRRVVGAGSLTSRNFGDIVQSCLVGAVAEAARWHTPERGTAGPAVDALWSELGELAGLRPVADEWTPTPVLRKREVVDLARWNDRRGRTREEVLALVDAAIARLSPAVSAQSRPASTDAARSAPPVGTGR